MTRDKYIHVSLGEIKVGTKPDEILTANGLGSCVAVLMYDPVAKIGGMVHIVLPIPPKTRPQDAEKMPGQYAMTAIPALVNAITAAGGSSQRLVVKMTGGAQMFLTNNPEMMTTQSVNVGIRNVIATKAALKEHGFTPVKVHTGGNQGRTVRLEIATGQAWLRVIGTPDFLW